MIWYTLAFKLGCPVQVLQRSTTVSEFAKWKQFLDMEPNLFHREDYYMVWLIRAVNNMFNSKAGDLTADLGKGLLSFSTATPKKEEEVEVPQLSSRAAWCFALGITPP